MEDSFYTCMCIITGLAGWGWSLGCCLLVRDGMAGFLEIRTRRSGLVLVSISVVI